MSSPRSRKRLPGSSSGKITLRPMRRADASAVARFMRAMAAGFGGTSQARSVTLRQHCFGPRRLAHVTVATLDGTVVGYVMTRDWVNFDHNAKVRHIQQLFVAESYRGHGIAKRLLHHTAQQALRQKCFRLILDVGKGNNPALRLYRQLGFAPYSGRLLRHDLEEDGLRRLAA